MYTHYTNDIVKNYAYSTVIVSHRESKNETLYSVTVRYRKSRYCHVMYKLLYPNIRVRTAPPISVRVRTIWLVLVLVLRFCMCPSDFCDSGPESYTLVHSFAKYLPIFEKIFHRHNQQ